MCKPQIRAAIIWNRLPTLCAQCGNGPRHAALLRTSKISLLIPPYSTGKTKNLTECLIRWKYPSMNTMFTLS